jgi:sugar O-acyltransferase (sialic acid O-acetyltransferase NeuD family)
MNKPVIFFGTSDLAKMLYILSKDMDDINVIAFMVDDEYCFDTEFCGLPVWETSTIDSNMIEQYDFLICVGYKNMRSRQTIYDKLSKIGCQFINFIYPTVTILPEVQMGTNNIFLSNVTIENNVQIGNNNIFWSQTLICHNGIIGNHNFFAPRTTFAGNCVIGDLCFFGVNTFAIDHLKICDETYVIAGGGLFSDTEKSTRYRGNPAKKIDTHEDNGICI